MSCAGLVNNNNNGSFGWTCRIYRRISKGPRIDAIGVTGPYGDGVAVT